MEKHDLADQVEPLRVKVPFIGFCTGWLLLAQRP
jgi:hypothetical protein